MTSEFFPRLGMLVRPEHACCMHEQPELVGHDMLADTRAAAPFTG